MSKVTYTPGRMVWRELMTHDLAKAKAFYGELFGWTFQDTPMEDSKHAYTIASIGGTQVCGMLPQMMGPEVPSLWLSYASTTDLDGALAKTRELGGSVAYGPSDIKGVGRFGMIMDPDGAALALLHSIHGDLEPTPPKLGEFCWESLATRDIERAKRFYQGVIGWQTQSMPQTTSTVFGYGPRPEQAVADVQLAEGMPPSWATYVVVDTIESARTKAEKLGATAVVPLLELPGIGRIAFIADPTGATLGLYQPEPR